jgi:RHS repeat-associated protein
MGSANTSANVVLSATNGACAIASRKGEYFRAELPFDNTHSPLWIALTNIAALPGGGSSDIITKISGHLALPKGLQTFVYDLDGNLTFDGIWIYEWDGENRLVAMTMTNVTGLADSERQHLEFAYDFQGRRVEKKVFHNGGSPWSLDSDTLFVYDGWNLFAELSSPNSALRTYMWGLDLSGTMDKAGGVGGLLMLTICGSPSTNCFVSCGASGNVAALADAVTASLLARYEYSPFGELLRATGLAAEANPFGFSTKFGDRESGLTYYGYRYYCPRLGRWLGRDELEEGGALNLYLALGNRPVDSLDPDGRWTTTELLVTSAINAGIGAGGSVLGNVLFSPGPYTERKFLQDMTEGAISGIAGGFAGKGLAAFWKAADIGVGNPFYKAAMAFSGSISAGFGFGVGKIASGHFNELKSKQGAIAFGAAFALGSIVAGGQAFNAEEIESKVLDKVLDIAGAVGASAAEFTFEAADRVLTSWENRLNSGARDSNN